MFWSGCAQLSKKGLEISVLALIDVASAMAWTLDVTQTPPKLEKKNEDGYTRINFYIEQIFDGLDHLTQVRYFVADGFYAKKKMFMALLSINKHLITKLCPDANLKFRLAGEHPKRKSPKAVF